MPQEMTLLDDGSERVPYLSPTFPMHASFCRLSAYPAMTCVCHWHHDAEFILMRQGSMRYQVNDRFVLLTAGQGVVVTPNQIHGIAPVDGADASFLCVVFPSELFSMYPDTARAARECFAGSAPFLLLDAGEPSDRPILETLSRLASDVERRDDTLPLDMLGSACRLLGDTGARLRQAPREQDARFLPLQQMMGFIQAHYMERISLEQIARAGALSKTACTALFRRVLSLTPISYLNDYRLERSMALLRDTAQSMTEIAAACGFCSSSYFAEQFQKRAGTTPTAFRRERGDE